MVLEVGILEEGAQLVAGIQVVLPEGGEAGGLAVVVGIEVEVDDWAVSDRTLRSRLSTRPAWASTLPVSNRGWAEFQRWLPANPPTRASSLVSGWRTLTPAPTVPKPSLTLRLLADNSKGSPPRPGMATVARLGAALILVS